MVHGIGFSLPKYHGFRVQGVEDGPNQTKSHIRLRVGLGYRVRCFYGLGCRVLGFSV